MSTRTSEMASSHKSSRVSSGRIAFAIALLSVTGAGFGEVHGGAILVSDLVVVCAVAGWWIFGRLTATKRRAGVILASTCTALFGVGGIYGGRDAVLLTRLAALPVLAFLAWRVGTRLSERRLATFMLATTAAASLLVLGPAIANFGNGTVDPSAQIDRTYSSMFPRDDSGFVFTSGSVIRSRGTFSHPNEAGGVMSVLTVAAVGIALAGRGLRVAAIGASLLGLGALVTTGSRSAFIGAALGIVVLLLYRFRDERRRAARLVARMAIAALLIALVGAISSHADRDDRGTYGSRVLSIADVGSDESVADRGGTIAASARAMARFPMGGGLERFNETVGTAHNSLLFAGAVFGVPFAVLVLVAFAYSARLALRSVRRPLVARGSLLASPLGASLLVWLAVAMAEDRPESAPTMALGAIAFGMTVAFRPRLAAPQRATD